MKQYVIIIFLVVLYYNTAIAQRKELFIDKAKYESVLYHIEKYREFNTVTISQIEDSTQLVEILKILSNIPNLRELTIVNMVKMVESSQIKFDSLKSFNLVSSPFPCTPKWLNKSNKLEHFYFQNCSNILLDSLFSIFTVKRLQISEYKGLIPISIKKCSNLEFLAIWGDAIIVPDELFLLEKIQWVEIEDSQIKTIKEFKDKCYLVRRTTPYCRIMIGDFLFLKIKADIKIR